MPLFFEINKINITMIPIIFLSYNDFLYETLIVNSINEEFNSEKIQSWVKKIKDKNQLLNNIILKFNEAKNINLKKHLSKILIIIFLVSFISKNNKWNDTKIDVAATELIKLDNVTSNDIKNIVEINYPQKFKSIPEQVKESAINIKNAKISLDAKNLIKEHEKLKLAAYAIGDGKITVGWGHAESVLTSPYKLGDKITPQQADILFNKDIKRIENGIKRLFLQWDEQDINVHLTQNMFDAIVSLGYNIGISGLRQSDFIQYLKKQDYMKAAEKIKTTKLSSKFPGLEIRREKEYSLFIKDLEP